MIRHLRIVVVVVSATLVIAGSASAEPQYPSYPLDPVMSWCDQVQMTLRQARMNAQFSLYSGDYSAANTVLANGMQEALSLAHFGRKAGPMTIKVLERGIQLAQAIAGSSSSELLGPKTLTYFLFSYYDFTDRVISQLDIPYYIPYYYGSNPGQVDIEEFESRYVQVAKEQIELILERMVDFHGGFVTPVGTPTAYLKALELASSFAAIDLRTSLWAVRYACAVAQLNGVSFRLHQFNSNPNAPGFATYRNEVEAVNRSYHETNNALSQVWVGHGCHQH